MSNPIFHPRPQLGQQITSDIGTPSMMPGTQGEDSTFPLMHKAIHTAEVRSESSFQAAQCQSRKNPRQLFLQLANATELVVVL